MIVIIGSCVGNCCTICSKYKEGYKVEEVLITENEL